MATETTFLGLTLPGLGEFQDSWDAPNNENFQRIDNWASGVGTEIIDARFGKTSLQAFLAIAHNSNGTLKPTDEVIAARNSPVYGDFGPISTPSLSPNFLSGRINPSDLEILGAREGQASVRAALAMRQALVPSMIMSGPKNANGYPTWMACAADKIIVDGSTTPIWLMIDGFMSRVRTSKQLTVAGSSGWYYLYADYQAAGVQTLDGDSRDGSPLSANGSTTVDPSNLTKRRFNDPTHYFSGLLKDVDVLPGDLLTIFNPTGGTVADAGNYYVKTLGVGDEQTLEIVGVFPGTVGMGGLNYEIRDPMAVTLGFSATRTEAPGRIFIGEFFFDGVAVLNSGAYPLRPYHYKDTFVGEWRQFDLSVSPYNQEEIWEHKLGSNILDVEVQVSQANDGSQPVEALSLAGVKNTLGTAVTQPTVNVTLVPGTAGGDPVLGASATAVATLSGVSLTGAVVPSRSAVVKWTRNQIFVKNATQQLLYTDYAGADRQTGYVRVVVRKRG